MAKKKRKRAGRYCPCPEGTTLVKRSPTTGKRLKRQMCARTSGRPGLRARPRARKGKCYKGRGGVKKSRIISISGLKGLKGRRGLRGASCGCSG